MGSLAFPVRRRSQRVAPTTGTDETLGAMRRTLLAMAAATLSGVVVPPKLKFPAKSRTIKAHRKFAIPIIGKSSQAVIPVIPFAKC